MAQKLMTPGVYIEEVNAFPGSVVEVATAIPAFIGYTEKATRNGKSLVNEPVRITSFADYLLLFGAGFDPKFTLKPKGNDQTAKHIVTVNGTERVIEYNTNNQLFMFNSIKLFYSNGGGTCYIVSVGTFEGKESLEIKKDELLGDSKDANDKPIEGGLKTLLKQQEPTMVVIPDAVALGDDCYEIYKQVLAHCAKMQNRVAILDVYDGFEDRVVGDASVDIITKFREKIGTENLNYSAAYYPWVHTNIVQTGEITFKNLDSSVKLSELLPEPKAKELIASFDSKTVPADPAIAKAEEAVKTAEEAAKEATDALAKEEAKSPVDEAAVAAAKKEAETKTAEVTKAKEAAAALQPAGTDSDTAVKKNDERNLHLGLMATSATYTNLLDEIRAVINLLPVASAMAGIYTSVDNDRGVWKSPANISLNSVIKPAANITHDEQEDLNVNAVSGKSINAIRTFPGVGTLVWGGRTLDGNSLDWRYINVRRTMIMLEQSIKLALRAYVFEPNDANTWVTVKSMIVNFLTEKWKQGALAGSIPEDAFDVQIGLGSTMTSLDILEGKMLVSIKLAIVRPAEFIVVTFEQQMQKS